MEEKKMGEPVDIVLMPPIQDTRFCYMIWLVRSMTVDKWVMIIEWISSSFHENTYVHMNVIEANPLSHKKKHHNLTGLITLLKCYWPMCYRINASGWIHGIKTMPSGSRTIFFSPRPCLAEVTCRFFCTAPLRSLFTDYIDTIYTILQFACSACYWYWSHLLMPVWYSSRFHSLPLLMLMTTLC